MASADYISREAAILEIQRHGVGCFDPDEFTPEQAERFVISRLKSIPAADVRPVVLCKDCLHEDCALYHGPNWFCADGERMEELKQESKQGGGICEGLEKIAETLHCIELELAAQRQERRPKL